MKELDLTGARYGSLVALSKEGMRGSISMWACRCDCGGLTTVGIGNLRNGHTKSCGCLRSAATTAAKTIHGRYGTPEHRSWSAMLSRCCNPTHPRYKDYGARGITVCKEWLTFEGFFADMGKRPAGTTLGRSDNNRAYGPGNCSWETPTTQGRNKRNTRRFRYNGLLATIPEHCERLNLNTSTVRSRFYTYGWSISKSLSTKVA